MCRTLGPIYILILTSQKKDFVDDKHDVGPGLFLVFPPLTIFHATKERSSIWGPLRSGLNNNFLQYFFFICFTTRYSFFISLFNDSCSHQTLYNGVKSTISTLKFDSFFSNHYLKFEKP